MTRRSSSLNGPPRNTKRAGHISRPSSSLRRQKSDQRDALPASVRTLVALRLNRSEDDDISPRRSKLSLDDEDDFPEDEVDKNLNIDEEAKTENLTDEEREDGDEKAKQETEEEFLNRYNVSIFDTNNAPPEAITRGAQSAGSQDRSFDDDDNDSFMRRYGLSIFDTNNGASNEKGAKSNDHGTNTSGSASLWTRSFELLGIDTEESTPVRAHHGRTKSSPAHSKRLPRNRLSQPLPESSMQSYIELPARTLSRETNRSDVDGTLHRGFRGIVSSTPERRPRGQDMSGLSYKKNKAGESRWVEDSDATVDAVLMAGDIPRMQRRSHSTGDYERFRHSKKTTEEDSLKEDSGSLHALLDEYTENNKMGADKDDEKRKKVRSLETREKFSLWRELEDLWNDCTYFCRCVQRDVCV